MAYIHKRGCTCEKNKKCTCGAKWAFSVDVGINPKTGDRKQKTGSGFRTKTEAETAATKVAYEFTTGTYVDEKNNLFKDFSEEWIEIYKAENGSKISTVRVRKHEIKCLMKHFAHHKMKTITRKMYQKALLDLKKEEYADNTISGIHATGRMIFRKAIELEIIKVDPTEYAKVPRTAKTLEDVEQGEIPKYLEKEDLATFLNAASKYGLERDYLIFLILSYTGMRAGELCALKWSDIDFKVGTLSITKTYYNPTNNVRKYILLPPKTKASIRTIVIDEIVLAELEKHKAAQNILIMKKRDVYYDKDFIIAKTGKYLGYPEFVKTIENRMARLLKLAKLNTDLTPHSLRHTHTSLLAEARVTLPEIMERLGHKDDETTKNIYLHVTKTMKKEASQKFSQLMKSLF